MVVTEAELRKFRRKLVEIKAIFGEVSASLPSTKDSWIPNAVSCYVDDFPSCCAVGIINDFNEGFQEATEKESLMGMIILIKEIVSAHKKKGGFTLLQAATTQEQSLWKQAFLRNGFKVLGRKAFINSKTGNKIWLLQKLL
jgi:hypothetical protein